MKFTMRSLFSLSEEDKREILEAVAPSAPPEDFIMINKEMWQQLSARLDKQEEMMKNLLVEITKNSVKLDELKRINEKQTVIAGMPSVTVPDDKKFVSMFISDEARKRDFFWWLRSAVGNRNFSRVNVDGSGNFEFANCPGGLVLGFCT